MAGLTRVMDLKNGQVLRAQLVNSSLEVACSDRRVLYALGRYFNTAHHPAAPEHHVAMSIGFDGTEFRLSSGRRRRELSPEMTAEAAWEEFFARLQTALTGFLQIGGLCLDGGGRRIIVVGEDRNILRSVAMHCLCQGIDVPSATGICVRGGMATPFALPIELSEQDLQRFRLITGRALLPRRDFDEMGTPVFQVTPADFGREWIAAEAPIDQILVLTWNPGGWSGFASRGNRWLLERILDATHIPEDSDASTKLRLLSAAHHLSASTPVIELRLGRPEAAPPLLASLLGHQSGA